MAARPGGVASAYWHLRFCDNLRLKKETEGQTRSMTLGLNCALNRASRILDASFLSGHRVDRVQMEWLVDLKIINVDRSQNLGGAF